MMFKKLILCAALSLAAADNVDTRVAINCGENSDNFKIVGQFAEPLEGMAEASLTASPGGSVVVKRASIVAKDGVVGSLSLGTDIINIIAQGECGSTDLEACVEVNGVRPGSFENLLFLISASENLQDSFY